jgi:hypothetical protein
LESGDAGMLRWYIFSSAALKRPCSSHDWKTDRHSVGKISTWGTGSLGGKCTHVFFFASRCHPIARKTLRDITLTNLFSLNTYGTRLCVDKLLYKQTYISSFFAGGAAVASSPQCLHRRSSSDSLKEFTASLICVPKSVQWKAAS